MARTDEFERTRDQIIARALRLLHVSTLSNPQDASYASSAEAFNAMVKSLERKGTKLWTLSDDTITCVVGTASYNLDADTREISDVYVAVSDTDHPIRLVTLDQYQAIPDKTDRGQPVTGYFDLRPPQPGGSTATAPKLYLHPVPSSAWTVKFQKVRRLYKFDAGSDDVDFPEHWMDALAFGLAATLSPEYGKPLEERDWLKREASGRFKDAFYSDRNPGDSRFVKGAF